MSGARIEAYDASVGGNLIGSDEFFGIGAGVGNFGQLFVASSGIHRIELFQPLQLSGGATSGDGLQFDDLSFTVVPEPSSLLLMLGIGVGAAITRRRISK